MYVFYACNHHHHHHHHHRPPCLQAVGFTSGSDGLGCRHNSYKHIKGAALKQTEGQKKLQKGTKTYYSRRTKAQRGQMSYRELTRDRNMYSRDAKLYFKNSKVTFC